LISFTNLPVFIPFVTIFGRFLSPFFSTISLRH
jgi:hypothetical protein